MSHATLFTAAAAGDLDMVNELLSNGAEVDARDAGGNTAMMLAIVAVKPTVVLALHAAGAKFTARNTSGVSAHMLAVNSGHRSILRAALDAVVDYDDYDYDYDDY